MDNLDFKKRDRTFYTGKVGHWDRVAVPPMTFLAIDGQGDPNGAAFGQAVQALYPMAYGVKMARKKAGADFTVPPLEALWWADDPGAFTSQARDAWQWRAMIRVPDEVDGAALEEVRAVVQKKQAKKAGGTAPETLRDVRLVSMEEGDCLQTLFVGPYTDETSVLAELHGKILPEQGLTFAGRHHEIYLSDPRRVAPDKLRTILRQPVRAVRA
ncbi:MAG TPA: hypothetical protein ENJ52_10825 [Aliiroseovarius sp.]|nr:hypothetical protein [Aliiroseovarius sp.]